MPSCALKKFQTRLAAFALVLMESATKRCIKRNSVQLPEKKLVKVWTTSFVVLMSVSAMLAPSFRINATSSTNHSCQISPKLTMTDWFWILLDRPRTMRPETVWSQDRTRIDASSWACTKKNGFDMAGCSVLAGWAEVAKDNSSRLSCLTNSQKQSLTCAT